MKFRKTSVATAVLAVLALGAASQASAEIYAGSRLLVKDLTVAVTNLDGPALTGFKFTVESTATLNGVSDIDNKTCSNEGCVAGDPVLGTSASEGAPIRTAGDFTFFGPGTTTTSYSGSAAEIKTAELVDGSPTTTNQISETELIGTGTGSGTTTLGSETSFNFVFVIDPETQSGSGNLFFSFKADPNLFVSVDTDNLIEGFSTAEVSASFNLVGTNGVQVSWAPDGAALGFAPANCDGGGLGLITCNELADEESLNIERTLPPANPIARGYSDDRFSLGSDLGWSSFAISVLGLPADTYTLSGTFGTTVRLEQEVARVPEPGTLLLLGSGLIGMGLAARRRRQIA